MRAFVKAAALPALLLLGSVPLAAAETACSPASAGARMCMAGEACTCAYDRGGQLTATAPGWRWSCSLLQSCDTPVPATLDNDQSNYPIILEQPSIQLPASRVVSGGPTY